MKKNIDTMYILTGQDTELYFPSKRVRHIAINDNVDTSNGYNELALQMQKRRFSWLKILHHNPRLRGIARKQLLDKNKEALSTSPLKMATGLF